MQEKIVCSAQCLCLIFCEVRTDEYISNCPCPLWSQRSCSLGQSSYLTKEQGGLVIRECHDYKVKGSHQACAFR